VRELCYTHRISLPSHVFPVPTAAEGSTTAYHLPEPIQIPLPDSPPPSTRAAFIQRLKLKHHCQSHLTYDENHNDDEDDDDDDDDHYGDDETERGRPVDLSPCSSKSTTPETQSPILPVDDDDGDHPHRWILSAARDEELEEWGQYLDEAGENRYSSDAKAASSASWTSIALSWGECVPIH
jgi:hypothetical protein